MCIARTLFGRVEGEMQGGMVVFRGVPVGEGQPGQPPHGPTPWRKVRRCVKFSIFNSQFSILNADVYTPRVLMSDRRPVVVTLAGDGCSQALARRAALSGMVGIRLRLRLGDAPGASQIGKKGAGHRAQSPIFNFQFSIFNSKDLAHSLQWTKENIDYFGGNGRNLHLLLSPRAAHWATEISHDPQLAQWLQTICTYRKGELIPLITL